MPFWPWSPTPTADPPPLRDPSMGMAMGQRDPAHGRAVAVPVPVPVAVPPPVPLAPQPQLASAAGPAWPPPHWKLGTYMTPDQQRAYEAWLAGKVQTPPPPAAAARTAPRPGFPAPPVPFPPFVIDRSAPPLPTRIVWSPPSYSSGGGELADTGGQ